MAEASATQEAAALNGNGNGNGSFRAHPIYIILKDFGIPTLFACAGLCAAGYVYNASRTDMEKVRQTHVEMQALDRAALKEGLKDAMAPVVSEIRDLKEIAKDQGRDLATMKDLLQRHDDRELMGVRRRSGNGSATP